ncbi:MAG: hypothetical protein IJN85_03910 [Oscillospiraceae bacterium]|nr:hypothetical protein [Oscillospiraceae bacterium]
MKRFIAILLTLAMPFTFVIPTFAAAKEEEKTVSDTSLDSAFVEGENSLIVFVTGIGQSFSYLFDESYTKEGAFENGTLQDYENYAPLIAQGKHIARWNLFNNYFKESFSKLSTIGAIVGAVGGLLGTLCLRENVVSDKCVYTLIENLFCFNTLDENGKGNERVVTPRYTIPLSEYPGITIDGKFESEAKNRFYGSIPCADVAKAALGENYEDYIYCYNYNAFSYTSNNVDGLNKFIKTILAENKVGAKKVVLVPMSMGASVVSAYLAKYEAEAIKDVRRVVSIVGCWEGSEVVYDLVTLSYAENSADLLYNGIIAEMIGEPWGYLVNFVLRFFSKDALRDFIDQALGAFVDVLFLDTPSLVALVPTEKYQEVRSYISNEKVLAETDFYYSAQSTLKERLAKLEKEGITFSFISAYGLPYGAETGDYKAFGFMNSAAATNSDEIINISSTAPGTTAVTPGTTFKDTQGRELSPDGSLDISTTYYKDSSWFFYKQKHELEYNNTALSLALNLALGTIKTVDDCDNLQEDGYYYPQFNESRNLKSLTRSYIPDLENYMEKTGYTLTADQQTVYNEVIAMTKNTVNDRDADDALIEKFRQMLVEIGVYEAEKEPGRLSKLFNDVMSGGNDLIYKVFGAKGFFDSLL